jgi:beta-lactamase regulating signal transducer with metallopeptidase domain
LENTGSGHVVMNNGWIDLSGKENFLNTDSDNIILNRISAFMNRNATLIVIAWFLFFIARCIRLFTGFHYIYRIRKFRNEPAPGDWHDRLEKLSEVMGVRQKIKFLRSELVSVPVVIGFFKPVILVPMGLLTHLPAEQVEAILMHELAHIRRKDFLVNLLQNLAETVFFFNPAIIWISSLIRDEREACCDDEVINHVHQKKTYLQALVSFQEFSLNNSGHALALINKKNHLLNRVSRMLTRENKNLNYMEKAMLMMGLFGIMAFNVISGPSNEKAKPVNEKNILKDLKIPSPEIILQSKTENQTDLKNQVQYPRLRITDQKKRDTVPQPSNKKNAEGQMNFPSISSNVNNDGNESRSDIEATDGNGKKYRISRVNGKITSLVVDGKTIPEAEWSNYQEVLDQIERQQSINRQMAKERRDQMQIERQQRQKMDAERRMEQTERRKEQLLRKRDQEREQQERVNSKLRMGKEEDKIRRETEIRERVERNEKLQFQRNREQEERSRGFRDAAESRRAAMAETTKKNSGTRIDIRSIVTELIENGLANDREYISFSLNNKSLVVNGKKQSSDWHKKLSEKYLNHPKDYFKYERNGNSTHISINKE